MQPAHPTTAERAPGPPWERRADNVTPQRRETIVCQSKDATRANLYALHSRLDQQSDPVEREAIRLNIDRQLDRMLRARHCGCGDCKARGTA